MGRLIDVDKFLKRVEKDRKHEIYMHSWTADMVLERLDSWYAPTAEAIPKADYEARLKADMVAMLTDMLIDVEEIASREQWCDYANDNCISRYDVEDLFQQKINALKADTEDQVGQTGN